MLIPKPPLLISDDSLFCNQFGSIRLTLVRKFFGLYSETIGSYTDKNGSVQNINVRVQTKRLIKSDIDEITRLYTRWRDLDEYMPVRYTFRAQKIYDARELNTTAKIYTNCLQNNGIKASYYKNYVFFEGTRTEWAFLKSCKRGNDVYIHKIKKRFKPLLKKSPIVYFDPNIGIKKTKMLYITGTTNPSLCNIGKAWLLFGNRWNSFITNIRRYFKDNIYYIRTWQSQANGYPHFHALLYFKNTNFNVVTWKDKDRQISYRLPSRSKYRAIIKNAWKSGHLDIVCVDNTQEAFRDLLKYVTRDLEGGESDLTNAMVWYFGKQAFSISKNFVKVVWKKDESIDLAEPSDADLINEISNNSKSNLIQIEIFPILPANMLDFSYQSMLYDYDNPPKPPPKLVWFLEYLTNDCDELVKTREDGVKIIIYKKR